MGLPTKTERAREITIKHVSNASQAAVLFRTFSVQHVLEVEVKTVSAKLP